MHFTHLRGVCHEPCLFLYKKQIEVVSEKVFLGLTFDPKLSFVPHINTLKAKCQKVLNILKVLSHTQWGADGEVLIQLYRSLVRSKLDYGTIVYGSARPSYLSLLDPIHHAGLRLSTGAFRTSPVQSLYAEANEPPLGIRRIQLAMQYCIRLSDQTNNLAYECVFSDRLSELYNSRKSTIPRFGIRILDHLNNLGVPIEDLMGVPVAPPIPPWIIKTPNVIFDMSVHDKSLTPPEVLKTSLGIILDQYVGFAHIYTDGSKIENTVGSAAVYHNKAARTRLHDGATVFSAEMRAIYLALDIIESNDLDNTIILSDSMSGLMSLSKKKVSNIYTLLVLEKLYRIGNNRNIIFCWVPSHVGITGNEKADVAARDALSLDPGDKKLPSCDAKSLAKKYALALWENTWASIGPNKLKTIKPDLGPTILRDIGRRDQVVMHRIRIGHTHLTSVYLLKGQAPPKCQLCQTQLTVQHIIADCPQHAAQRTKTLGRYDMLDIFVHCPKETILQYLHDINVYKLL